MHFITHVCRVFVAEQAELVIYTHLGCDDVVGPEGIEKFCEDIGVEPENVSRFFSCFLHIWLHFYI